MKKEEIKREFIADNRIELALFLLRNIYPNLYRDAGENYIRFLLKKLLHVQVAS